MAREIFQIWGLWGKGGSGNCRSNPILMLPQRKVWEKNVEEVSVTASLPQDAAHAIPGQLYQHWKIGKDWTPSIELI